MKTYNKPEILIENINIDDVIMVSVQESFSNWNDATIDFDKLWD